MPTVLSMSWGGLDGVVVEFLPPTYEAVGSNLGPGALCWEVGSYYLPQYDPGC